MVAVALAMSVLALGVAHVFWSGRKKKDEDRDVVTAGELFVTREGCVTLTKPFYNVKGIHVAFKPPHNHPCVPGHKDYLSYELVERRRALFLKLTWRVSSPRTIVWSVTTCE